MSDDVQDVVSELKDEVKSLIRGRLANPFLGAFLVAWLAWNHRLFFVLFSSNSLEYRFKYVDDKLYPDVWSFSYMNFLGPLLSCAVLIFLIPWVVEAVHRWNLKMKRRLHAAELRSEGLNPLSEAQSLALRNSVWDRNKRITEQRVRIGEDDQNIARLSAMVSALLDTHDTQKNLEKFLCAGTMSVTSGVMPIGSSKYVFERDGNVRAVFESATAIRDVATWKCTGLELFLMDVDGKVLTTMRFDARQGVYEELYSGVRRLGL